MSKNNIGIHKAAIRIPVGKCNKSRPLFQANYSSCHYPNVENNNKAIIKKPMISKALQILVA